MAGPYFADAFYWVALATPRDAWHARVAAWEQAHENAKLVVTEEVLTEVLNWFSGRGRLKRQHAAATVRDIRTDANFLVLPQTTADFDAALAFYEARLDKGYSLTDCRSMNALRDLGIAEVLTNDHHFTQEGFTALFPGP